MNDKEKRYIVTLNATAKCTVGVFDAVSSEDAQEIAKQKITDDIKDCKILSKLNFEIVNCDCKAEEENNIEPCLVCKGTNILLRDCGYTTFNYGIGECKDCGRKVSAGCDSDPSKERLTKIWNEGQKDYTYDGFEFM